MPHRSLSQTPSRRGKGARENNPAIILSDVRLLTGTGPLAVGANLAEFGEIPVLFITGTPDDCHPREPSAVILSKPVERQLVLDAFRRLVPV